MGGIKRAGVRAADSEPTAERQMIEIELIVLAAMPAEIGDVVEPVVDRAIDEVVEPDAALPEAQKLAADKSIVALVGPSCSDEVVGGIKALTEAGMTTISGSATRPALTNPDRDPSFAGFLRTAHSDAFQGKAVAEFVFNQLKAKTAATIHDGSAYAQALQGVFADNFKTLGGTITDQEAVKKDDTDMKPVLTKISTSNSGAAPEALYYPIFGGWTWGGGAKVQTLWVRPDLRRHGYGTRLLAAAEGEARARGCDRILLDTFSFQAPLFYQKHGYEVMGVENDTLLEHKHYRLRKRL